VGSLKQHVKRAPSSLTKIIKNGSKTRLLQAVVLICGGIKNAGTAWRAAPALGKQSFKIAGIAYHEHQGIR
jgi:hypothetical protein